MRPQSEAHGDRVAGLALRLHGALDVLRGRKVAVAPVEAERTTMVLASELRRIVDLLSFHHELEPFWFQHATTARLDSVEAMIGLERSYRQARWEFVEAGGWPKDGPWPR